MDAQDFRSLQEAYLEVVEGAAGDVAARAQKLANQRKGQTPERKATYQGLADKAAQRERGPYKRGDTRTGMSQKERDERREADAYHDDVHGDGSSTYGKGGITKNPRKLAQQKARGQHAEEFELWVNELVEEGYDLSDYTWDDMLDIYEAEKPFPYEKVTAQQKKHTAAGRYGNMMKMGLSKRRAKEAKKTGGSQQDAGKGWYHAKEEYVDEEITSEKGKAKAAEMIAARSTPSGRAKSGQGANVAKIKHIRRSNRDGLGGTPPNRKVAGSNWPKSYTGIGGRGNKAARRAGTYKEEFELWVNSLVEEGYDLSDYTWNEMYGFYLDEQVDIYDIILLHLLDEGYAETPEAAEKIMVNMSEEWRQDIMEISDRKVDAVGRRRQANVDKAMSSDEYISDKPGATQKLATAISKKNRFNYLNKKRKRMGG
jgi:hypothetical protein